MKQAKIQEVRAYVIAPSEMGADYHNQHGNHWIIDLPIANPMSVYEEYKAERTSWGINALGTVVVQVELTDGTIGIGCSIGGEPACYIIEKHLSVLSKDRIRETSSSSGIRCGGRRCLMVARD